MKAFLAAFTKGVKDVVANPDAAIADVKARDGIINTALETRRLQACDRHRDQQPDARAEGFGQIDPGRPVLDGVPGVRCVCTKDARQPRRRVERILPAGSKAESLNGVLPAPKK